MRRKLLIVIAIAFAVVAIAPNASAGLVPIGDPQLVGSWAQRFIADTGQYNTLEAFMVSGSTFEAPDFANFSAAGWSVGGFDQSYVQANGPLTTTKDLQFDISFITDPTTPLVFDFYAWDGTTLADSARASWNGGGWSFAPIPTPDKHTLPVPDGGTTLALLGFALMGLGALRRKF